MSNLLALSSVAPPLLSHAELGRIAGPLLIGYILNWGFFGILSMQVYIYYLAFPKDRTRHKALVYVALILEAAQTFLFTSSAFKTFATGFGDVSSLNRVDILWFSVPVMSGLVAFVAQLFYAYRITTISGTKYLAGLIMTLSSLQLGGAITLGVQTKNAVVYSRLIGNDTLISSGIWQGSSVACNAVIAMSMLHYLRYQGAFHGPGKANGALAPRVMRIVIESGALTAIIAIVTLVLSFLPGRPNYYQASISVLAKLYSNSMMVAFNSRMKIGSAAHNSTAQDVQIPLSAQLRTTRLSNLLSNNERVGTTTLNLNRSMHEGIIETQPNQNRSQKVSEISGEDIYADDGAVFRKSYHK